MLPAEARATADGTTSMGGLRSVRLRSDLLFPASTGNVTDCECKIYVPYLKRSELIRLRGTPLSPTHLKIHFTESSKSMFGSTAVPVAGFHVEDEERLPRTDDHCAVTDGVEAGLLFRGDAAMEVQATLDDIRSAYPDASTT